MERPAEPAVPPQVKPGPRPLTRKEATWLIIRSAVMFVTVTVLLVFTNKYTNKERAPDAPVDTPQGLDTGFLVPRIIDYNVPPPSPPAAVPAAAVPAQKPDGAGSGSWVWQPFAAPLRSNHSALRCAGGRTYEIVGNRLSSKLGEHDERSCLFENVCIQKGSTDLLFYEPEDVDPEPVVSDGKPVFTHDGQIDTFPEVLLNTMRNTGKADVRQLYVKRRFGGIPANAVWDPSPVAAVVSPFCAENFGHALGDDIFAVYVMLRDINLFTHDMQMIFKGGCGSELCCKFYSSFMPAMSDKPMVTLESVAEKASPPVCYSKLMAGTASKGMLFRPTMWADFIATFTRRVLKAAGKTVPPPPTKHRVGVAIKHGRRQVLNTETIQKRITTCFVGVEADLIDPPAKPLHEQIEMARRYSVMFTPAGGISFIGTFLPPGGALMQVDVWDTKLGRSTSFEEYIHDYNTPVKYYDIPIDESDVVINAKAANDPSTQGKDDLSKWKAHRLYGDVKVPLDTLVYYTYHALRYASAHLGLPMPEVAPDCRPVLKRLGAGAPGPGRKGGPPPAP